MKQPDNDLIFGLVLILGFAALGCLLIKYMHLQYLNRRELIKLFLIAIVVRYIAAIVIYDYGLVEVLGDEDSGGWYNGVTLMKTWMRQKVGFIDLPVVLAGAYDVQNKGYTYLVGALFYLTNAPARLPAAALNCFFGAMTIVFIYRIARTLFSQWVATRAGWLACFFPSLIIWSAQTLKEPVIICLETMALYACVQLKLSGFSLKYILMCASSVLLLYPFRFYAAFLAAIVAASALIIPRFGKAETSFGSVLALAVLVVPLMVSTGMLARSEGELERLQANRIQQFRSDISKGTGSGYQPQYDMRTSSGFVIGTAVGAAHLFLAPFPWQLGGGSLRMVLTLPELLVWWWLFFVGVITGIWYAIRKKFSETLPLLIFLVGLGLLYSILFGNVGLVFRQRAQLLPFLLILGVAGLEQRAIKKILKSRGQPVAPVLVQVKES
jgi:hypothetical protein